MSPADLAPVIGAYGVFIGVCLFVNFVRGFLGGRV